MLNAAVTYNVIYWSLQHDITVLCSFNFGDLQTCFGNINEQQPCHPILSSGDAFAGVKDLCEEPLQISAYPIPKHTSGQALRGAT